MRRPHLPSMLFSLAALLVAAPASAQDPGTGDPRERGKALVAGLERDPTLLGAQHFGIVLGERKSIGTGTFVVEEAPEGSGAAYRVTSTLKMAVGPASFLLNAESLLDAQLALISSTSREEDTEGDAVEKTVKAMRRTPQGWVLERTVNDGETERRELPAAEPNHGDLPSMLLLSRVLDTSAEREYVLRGIHWDDGEEPVDGGPAQAPEPSWQDVVIRSTPPAPLSYRGAERQAARVVIEREGEEPTTFAVTPERELLAWWTGDRPIRLIKAASAEEAKQDLPGPAGGEDAAAAGPKQAVVRYFEVAAKVRPVDALDEVMDWKAVKEDLAKEDPSLNDVTPDLFGQLMKQQLSGSDAQITQEQVEMVAAMLQVKVDGERATVAVPGQDEDPFRLERRDGRWRILHFPH